MGSIKSLGLNTEYIEQNILTQEAIFEFLQRSGKALYGYTFLRPTEEDATRIMINGSNFNHCNFYYRGYVCKDDEIPEQEPLATLLPNFAVELAGVIDKDKLDGPFMVEYINSKVEDCGLTPWLGLSENDYMVFVQFVIIPCWVS